MAHVVMIMRFYSLPMRRKLPRPFCISIIIIMIMKISTESVLIATLAAAKINYGGSSLGIFSPVHKSVYLSKCL